MRIQGAHGLIALALVVSACQSGPRSAPVLDRKIDATEPSAPSRARLPVKTSMDAVERGKSTERDWRPETYTVNRGDTLYAIALDHGLDYRDLATWNAIADPNRIQVGQILSLRPPVATGRPVPVEPPPVVAKSSVERAAPTGEALPAEVPVKSEPRAERLQYSDEAYARIFGVSPQAATVPAPVSDTRGPATEIPGAASSTVQPLPSPAPVSTTTAPVVSPSTKPVAAEPSVDTSTWLWPARGEVISAYDGARNKGIAIAGKLGDPVIASNAGKVVYVGRAIQTYGALVILKHGADYLTVYAHNSAIAVKEGQWVTAGQKIAEMGERSPKMIALHFELRRLGQPIDPAKYLPAR